MRRAYTRPRNDAPSLLHHYISELHVNWYLIKNYLGEHPESAAAHDRHGATALYRALYRRVDDYPPLSIVTTLLDLYPQAMWIETSSYCPLKTACWRRSSFEILEMLIKSRPSRPYDVTALFALWESHRTLLADDVLSVVTAGGREGVEIWMKLCLLLHYCTSARNREETYQMVHAAAATLECPLEHLQLSISLFPEQINETDVHGKLPLHHLVASRAESEKVTSFQVQKLHQLLDGFPEATNIRDQQSQRLPLHISITSGQSWDLTEPLLRAHDTLSQVDGATGLHPFQLAACTEACSLSVVFGLMRAAPYLVKNGGLNSHPRTCLPPDLDPNHHEMVDEAALHHNTNQSLLEEQSIASQDPTLVDQVRCLFSHRIPDPEWLAVHAAVSISNFPVAFLELVVTLQRHELSQRDASGNLPLHLLLQKCEGEQENEQEDDSEDEDMRTSHIKVVLQHYPEAAKVLDANGRPPLHSAVRAGLRWSSLNALVHAYPSAICQRDQGLYPFQIAAINEKYGVSEVYQLLLAAPHLLCSNEPPAP